MPVREVPILVKKALTEEPFGIYLLSRIHFSENYVFNLMNAIGDVSVLVTELYFINVSFLLREFVKEIYYQQVKGGMRYNCLEDWVTFHNMFTTDLIFFIMYYEKIKRLFRETLKSHRGYPDIISNETLNELRRSALEFRLPREDAIEIVDYIGKQFTDLSPPKDILRSEWGFSHQNYVGLLYYSKGCKVEPSWRSFFSFLKFLNSFDGEEWQQAFHHFIEIGKMMGGKQKEYIFAKIFRVIVGQVDNLMRDPVAAELAFKLFYNSYKKSKGKISLYGLRKISKSIKGYNLGPFVRWFYCKYSVVEKYENRVIHAESVIPF